MHYIFYFLQFISPSSIQEMASTAPVSVYERSYKESSSRAARQTEEATCLATALYYEARGRDQKKMGMVMVGLVILNRTKNPPYANTVCGVIKERNAFQWYKHSKKNKPKEYSRYLLAQSVAKDLLSGKYSGKMSSSVLWFKVCDRQSELFTKLKFYKRQQGHCFYNQGKV